ncbi:MAG: hypothetical protein COX62_08455 [Deltaproteobacteria bacterium CG_4_10_14_0_2_um_filter_43_8]|nr:MAG: hypothetical protein COX62_08455 [Deltaproteobacteria bacterium CG_4_10_14_0_2_um_filter_43_8]
MKRLFAMFVFLLLSSLSVVVNAYPNEVKATLNLGLGSIVTGLAITSNNNDLFASYSDVLNDIDLGLWGLAANQPPALTSDDGTSGNIEGIVYSPDNSYIYAVQDNGHILTFFVNNITATPTVTKVTALEGKKLGPVAIDTSSTATLYIVDNANSLVYVWQAGKSELNATVDLKLAPDLTNVATAFNVLDILFAPETNEVYVATDVGIVAYFSTDNIGNPNDFVLDDTKAADIGALAVTPNGSKIYAATGAQLPPSPDAYPTIYVVSTSTHQEVASPMQLVNSENTAFTSMVTMSVHGGLAPVYGFVSGSKGVSVFNTTNNQFIDVDTSNACTSTCDPIATSSTSGPMIASGDNYIYLAGSGNVLVITDNPWIDISDISYTDSTGAAATALQQGGSCAMTFQSDTTGDYTVMVGGTVEKTGTGVIDTNGASGGSVTADTDTIFTFNYDDNSSAFEEGDNTVYIFVTSSDNTNLKGRSADTVTVDTPPGEITISSTGFGNERAYITFGRLTANDISHYNLYSDTDATAVQTKTDVSATVSQVSAGSSVTGHMDGLTNGTTYYLAVEGVDAGGNVGPRAYLLNGTSASAMPQETVGPAGLSGETGGCALVRTRGESRWTMDEGRWMMGAVIILGLLVIASIRRRRGNLQKTGGYRRLLRFTRNDVLLIIMFFLSFGMPLSHADDKAEDSPKPVWWSMELKVGFWMPTGSTTKKFFNKCCNIVTTVEGGLLYKGRYGAEIGVGVMSKDRPALGAITGEPSGDTFNMFLLPMETNAVWRIDYAEKQWVVPYTKFGFDYVYYREGDRGKTINGLKTGLHGIGGVQIYLPFVDGDSDAIKKMFFTMEARYGWVNSFGKKGLDLSGMTYSAGLLFEF